MLTKSLVVYDNNLGQVLRFVGTLPAGDKRFAEVPLKYEVKLSQEAYDLLQRNPLIKQAIQVEMIALVRDMVVAKLAPFTAAKQAWTEPYRKRVEGMLTEGQAQVNQLIQRKLDRHADVDDAWGKYYRAQRKELIFAAVGLGTFVVSTALAVPSMGASLAVAIVAGARALMTGITKLAECARTAEQYEARVAGEITTLWKAYDKKMGGSVAKGRAMQIGGSVANATGVPAVFELFMKSDLLPNMGKIKGDLAIYKGKLGNLYATANLMTVHLFELLDRAAELRALYKAIPGFDPAKTGGFTKLAKLEGKIDKLLQSGSSQMRRGFIGNLTISDAYLRYENGWPKATYMEQVINTDLARFENSPLAVARIGKGLAVLTNLAFSLANYQEAMQIPSELAKATLSDADTYKNGFGLLKEGVMTVQQVAGTSTAWTGDLIGTGKDLDDLAVELGLKSASDPAVVSYAGQLEAGFKTALPAPAPPRPRAAAMPMQRMARPTGTRPLPPIPQSGTAKSSPPPNRPPPPVPSR